LSHYPKLAKPPIVEAIVDIRVVLDPTFDVKKLKELSSFLSENYPGCKERKRFQGTIEFQEENSNAFVEPTKIDGFLFTSQDKTQIAQFRLDGFTFNKLTPYTNWESIRNESKKLWDLYYDLTSPIQISRIALRYINNLKIPLPIDDFKKYLVTFPIVPEGLPQGISSFLTRIVLPNDSIPATAIITQGLEMIQISSDFAPVILDIDVFKQSEEIKNKKLWDLFEKLRQFKNDIFFKSITNELRSLYE
jgi:uncharacterized protein (TIGR04255 family)